MTEMKNRSIIYIGDCISKLRTLPKQSVNCCVTSPPYWGLRDYGVDGQLGLEKTPEEYVAKLVAVFAEVRRVLRGDGTLWLNLGDSYNSSPSNQNGESSSSLHGGSTTAWAGQGRKKRDIPGLKPKDLVGIPWLVAFALQQPYENHILKAATDRAWMAAMIDAEGCVTIPECKSSHGSGSSYPPIVQIRMCDTEALDRCVELVGKGGNMGEQLPPSYSEANQRPAYQWRINGRVAADVLADAYPYLLIKRRQACVAWTLQKIRDGYETKKGVSIPSDALAKQVLCREIMKKLNQRESIDLPSWIEEPETIIEPGYYLRQDLIWAKPNPMPESVTDRCTKSHEYIFLLAKSERYYYDAVSIREPASDTGRVNGRDGRDEPVEARPPGSNPRTLARIDYTKPRKVKIPGGWNRGPGAHGTIHRDGRTEAEYQEVEIQGGRNKRSVWTVPTHGFKGAHFATFPEALIVPCILAGCPEGGTVLDPFFGAGTVGVVAKKCNRQYLGIELNP